MAKIPQVNENNEIVGETTIREAKENGWPRRVARLYIFDSSNTKVLLQKRSNNVHTHPGKWDISGGHVDLGETYTQAAEREVQEELGGEVSAVEISEPVFFENTFYVVCKTNTDSEITFAPNNDEVDEVKWTTVNELSSEVKNNPEDFASWLVHSWLRFNDKLTMKS